MPAYTRITPLGAIIDPDPVEVNGAAYQELRNMVAKPRKMVRAKGSLQIWPDEAGPAIFGEVGVLAGETPFPPYWMLYSPQLGVPIWLYAGATQIAYINETGDHNDISPLTYNTAFQQSWSGGNLNGIAVLNTPENPGHYWYLALPRAIELPGLRPNARYLRMRTFKYHIIGLGFTDGLVDYPDAVHWSEAADPGQIPQNWVPGPDNDAGDNILADENGVIIDGASLRDAFFIYKQDSVYEMTFIGGNEVFSFRKVFGSTGVLADNCIARVQGTHVVLGNGDIYQHDGQNFKSLIDGKLRESFFAAIDTNNFRSSFVVYLEPADEVWFCVPATGQTRPNLALVWNVATGEFGYRDTPDTDFGTTGVVGAEIQAQETWDAYIGEWDTDTSQWLEGGITTTEDSLVLVDTANSVFYLADQTTTHNGEPYDSFVATYGLDLGDPTMHKAVRRVYPRVNAPLDTVFDLSLFTQRSAADPIALEQTITYIHNGEGVALDGNGRYVGLKLSTSEQVEWDIAGFDVEYWPRGRF